MPAQMNEYTSDLAHEQQLHHDYMSYDFARYEKRIKELEYKLVQLQESNENLTGQNLMIV